MQKWLINSQLILSTRVYYVCLCLCAYVVAYVYLWHIQSTILYALNLNRLWFFAIFEQLFNVVFLFVFFSAAVRHVQNSVCARAHNTFYHLLLWFWFRCTNEVCFYFYLFIALPVLWTVSILFSAHLVVIMCSHSAHVPYFLPNIYTIMSVCGARVRRKNFHN